LLWFDGDGLCLFQKRLERGRFIWPTPADGVVAALHCRMGDLVQDGSELVSLAPAP
jgi:transposase